MHATCVTRLGENAMSMPCIASTIARQGKHESAGNHWLETKCLVQVGMLRHWSPLQVHSLQVLMVSSANRLISINCDAANWMWAVADYLFA